MNGFLVLLCVIAGLAGFILLCHGIVELDNACKACVRTRKWQKEKNRRLDNPESVVEEESLIANAANTDNNGNDNEIELELQLELVGLSEEQREAKIKAREEESKPDWHLTSKQKFKKEYIIVRNAFKAEQARKAEEKVKEKERQDEETRLATLTKEAVRKVANKNKEVEFQKRLDEAVGKELERMGLDRDGNSVAESSSGGASEALPTYDHAVSNDE